MITLTNYWRETSPKIKKLSLWLKGSIATLAASAYASSNDKLGFWLLVAGAVISGILECLPPDDGNNTNGSIVAPVVICIFAATLFSSCRVVKPQTNTVIKDSTITRIDTVRVTVPGAYVSSGFNCDSLVKKWMMERDHYKQDSTNAANNKQPIPPRPKPVIQYITDPQTKAQLSYWIDQAGRVQVGCEAKDQKITELQKEITRLHSVSITTITPPIIKQVTPWWNWLLIGVLATLFIISIITRFIKL
jgi:hypothetical protein